MKTLDSFLIHDLGKLFRHAEIGFVIDDIQAYNKVLASVRIRCYDILTAMEKAGVCAELYKPFKRYKAVIFTKTRSDAAVRIAQRLKNTDTLVISDNFCEYLTDESRSADWERKNILKILECADAAVAYSGEQYKQFCQYHERVHLIQESVNDTYFKACKEHVNKSQVTLIYSGYRSNATHLELIGNAISRLQREYKCKILLICEGDPDLKSFPYEYRRYDQKRIVQDLLLGDIMVAPRPMEGIEKQQHTLTKIASPMAIGLPVVASPIPSYIGTPAVLCSNETEWYDALGRLILDAGERQRIGKESREFVRTHLATDTIVQEYLSLICSLEEEKGI